MIVTFYNILIFFKCASQTVLATRQPDLFLDNDLDAKIENSKNESIYD